MYIEYYLSEKLLFMALNNSQVHLCHLLLVLLSNRILIASQQVAKHNLSLVFITYSMQNNVDSSSVRCCSVEAPDKGVRQTRQSNHE